MIPESVDIVRIAFVDGGEDSAAEARSKYKSEFPARSVRRMTHLGILTGLCLNRMQIDLDTPIVYGSKFAESRSLEDYIASFPTASPALFQSSIHPSAVEQSLIGRQQPLQRFYPITAERNLGGHALELLFLLPHGRGIAVVGEERGTWLCPHQLASDRSFACAMQTEAKGARSDIEGRLWLDHSYVVEPAAAVEAIDLADAIRHRSPLRAPSLALNAWIRLDFL